MNDGCMEIPAELWRDVRGFFLPLIAPCKDCVKGNLDRCWHGQCPAFRFRNIGKRIAAVENPAINKPVATRIENEIIAILRAEGQPMYPSCVRLSSSISKANKYTAIKRLIARGVIEETRINDWTRKISLKQ